MFAGIAYFPPHGAPHISLAHSVYTCSAAPPDPEALGGTGPSREPSCPVSSARNTRSIHVFMAGFSNYESQPMSRRERAATGSQAGEEVIAIVLEEQWGFNQGSDRGR